MGLFPFGRIFSVAFGRKDDCCCGMPRHLRLAPAFKEFGNGETYQKTNVYE